MKLPFTIYDLRSTIREESGRAVSPLTAAGAHGVTRPTALNHQSSIINHKSQKGVALVLTLILLSVALVMTLAFLAISGREQGSVTTQTDTATTRLAADAGLAAAEAQIAANILSTTNPYSFGLIVSTNYAPFTYTNPADFATLQYSPRAPVWLSNAVTHAMENRFYLDLNRNGVPDPNGWVADVDNTGKTNGVFSFEVGDPEWIGVLERPDLPYGPNNPFIARYAFIALPVGNSLDLNAIYNQVFDEAFAAFSSGFISVNPPSSGPANDLFFRNQGVGSWELNLAAFLADLNTNQWGQPVLGAFPNTTYYFYQRISGVNVGLSFVDARALIAYRYANNYNSLQSVDNLFGGPFPTGIGDVAFRNDNIDGYSDGRLQITADTNVDFTAENPALPWAGADNTNRFFDLTADLFNPANSPAGVTAQFVNRLSSAGTNNSTYNRYTFYRMLAQLGTDTAPDSGRMNLNYDNLDIGISAAASATNFMAWTPLGFFNNAADRMLRAYTAQWAVSYILTNPAPNVTNLMAVPDPGFVATFNVTAPFGVTSIPVWVSNRFVYTPAVNRLLQLAANMYDATTTNHYPDIFRPVFSRDQNGLGTNIFIIGYTDLNRFIDHSSQMTVGANNGVLDPPMEVTALPLGTNLLANVYGVPWIIGAKKGFPNFNEFTIESAYQLTRKLEVIRDTNATPQPHITWTNQMYLINMTNYFGVEFWNSYHSNYVGPVDVMVRCSSSLMLTNDAGMQPPANYYHYNYFFQTNQTIKPWYGWNGVIGQQQTPSSFVVPLNTGVMALTNAIYIYNNNNPLLIPAGNNPVNYQDQGIRPLPHFGLLMTNRLQVAIIDYSAGANYGRVVDYVQLGGMDSSQDVNSDLLANDPYHFWDNIYTNGVLLGVLNQIQVSMDGVNIYGQGPTGNAGWTDSAIPGGPANDVSPAAQQAFFRGFFASDGHYNYPNQQPPTYYNTQSAMQAPYTPSTFVTRYTSWQANDPLVHYLASDLAPVSARETTIDWPPSIVGSLGVVNSRYQPWGKSPPTYVNALDQDQNSVNLAFKDPLVRESDSWDFPAGKLPTAGWLGRVHRGTPWQTVYLKATNILAWANNAGQNGFNTWKTWTGDINLFDAANAAPVEDHLLFDLFTTAFNDNATRGQLSVNVSSNSLAAWSAVFSGIVTLSNNLPNSGNQSVVSPLRAQRAVPSSLYLAPSYSYTNIINPAGGSGMNSALGQIVAGIDRTRATFTNADGLVGVFEHKGDLLAVPELTERSPFLNTSAAQQGNGISDEMYEWLPQQAMSLVRVGAPRYVIYSYGQALKPAPNGTYLGSATLANGQPAFGMVTNYQVMSETATRAVVRLDTVRTNANDAIIVTPPRAVIESFNVLPPD